VHTNYRRKVTKRQKYRWKSSKVIRRFLNKKRRMIERKALHRHRNDLENTTFEDRTMASKLWLFWY
jgi:hypothetical protein